MEKNDMIGKLAIYSFLGGIGLAIIFGLVDTYYLGSNGIGAGLYLGMSWGVYIAWLLIIIGIIVGILAFLGKGTITKEEVPAFLTAGIALLIMYGVFKGVSITLTPWLGSLLVGLTFSLALFIAPAVALLAIKAIWDIGKSV